MTTGAEMSMRLQAYDEWFRDTLYQVQRALLDEPLRQLYDWLEEGSPLVVVVGSKGEARRIRKNLHAWPMLRRHAALRGKVKVISALKPGMAYLVNLDLGVDGPFLSARDAEQLEADVPVFRGRNLFPVKFV